MADAERATELDTGERLSGTDAPDARRSKTDFRDYLYPTDHPNIAPFRGLTPRAFAAERLRSAGTRELLTFWETLTKEPFRGVTCDGRVISELYGLARPSRGEEAPTEEAASAASGFLRLLPEHLKHRVVYDVRAEQWRMWSNPEIMIHEVGLRLEDLAASQREAAIEIMRRSLSPEAFTLLRALMATNAHLGRLVDLPAIMNEHSYQFALFGEPSSSRAWGWQLYGHHVSISVVFVGRRMVISPVFLGAEPAIALDGDTNVPFSRRHELGLELMRSLNETQRDRAQLYTSVRSPDMPENRLLPVEERHLAGAFRDNRIIPYEGIPATDLSERQRRILWDLVEDQLLLPAGPARSRMREIRRHVQDTWFCWIGGVSADVPVYFRVQSPVVLAEFDHHAGVWLSNQFPAVFHVHTTMREPNGNDYGRALIAQAQEG